MVTAVAMVAPAESRKASAPSRVVAAVAVARMAVVSEVVRLSARVPEG
jgi:hypothetical protein